MDLFDRHINSELKRDKCANKSKFIDQEIDNTMRKCNEITLLKRFNVTESFGEGENQSFLLFFYKHITSLFQSKSKVQFNFLSLNSLQSALYPVIN